MKYMARVACALVVLSTPANADEGVTSLSCYVDDWSDWVMYVELNEANGTVSYSIPSKRRSARRDAIFTPESVSFDVFQISRVDLKLSHENSKLFQDAWGVPRFQYGHCELREVQRVF